MSRAIDNVRRWSIVPLAALAMAGTLPGRTQGLGLITEPLLKDLSLPRTTYADINFWATILGALACLPAGRWLDRFGSRRSLIVVSALLGVTVMAMSGVAGAAWLFALVLLTRALGQSALSVISISMAGKASSRRVGARMALYSVLLTILFVTAFSVLGPVIQSQGWRAAWWYVGFSLVAGLVPLAWLLGPREDSEPVDAPAVASSPDERPSMTLREAVWTPAFWLFAAATSIFALATSGLGLFNESVLAELGFDAAVYYRMLGVTTMAGLCGQFLCGMLCEIWSHKGALAVAMALYAAALGSLPLVRSIAQLHANAILMGAAGGMITVMFFSVWPVVFGRRHLGRIQGAAQMLTVLGSAAGPVLFAYVYEASGSYFLVCWILSLVVLSLAVAAVLLRFGAEPSSAAIATDLAATS